MPLPGAPEVTAFWFHELPPAAWWKKDPALDRHIADRFGTLHAAAVAGDLDDWRAWPGYMMALILLLDQFSRNIHRDTPQAFAADGKALTLAQEAVDRGMDIGFVKDEERLFFYLPFEHSEEMAHQEVAYSLFTARMQGPDAPRYVQFADAHRRVIRDFGRFPHRNGILGRISTPEEEAYLAKHGGF